MPIKFIGLAWLGLPLFLLICGCGGEGSEDSSSFCSERSSGEEIVKNSIQNRFQRTLHFGDQLSRQELSSLTNPASVITQASSSYVRVDNSSGFYLGLHNGWHLVGTAFHVVDQQKCDEGVKLKFLDLGIWVQSQLCVSADPLVDFTIVAFANEGFSHADQLVGRESWLDHSSQPRQNEPLFIIGRSTDMFSPRKLELIQDADCRVLSRTGDFQSVDVEMGQVLAFAMGCDVTFGDSGSAVRRAESGRVVGVVSHASMQPKTNFQCSQGVVEEIDRNYSSVWETALATPAVEILNVLQTRRDDPAVSDPVREVLGSLLEATKDKGQ